MMDARSSALSVTWVICFIAPSVREAATYHRLCIRRYTPVLTSSGKAAILDEINENWRLSFRLLGREHFSSEGHDGFAISALSPFIPQNPDIGCDRLKGPD